MVGKDQEPIDLSQKSNVEILQKSMGTWQEKVANDEGQYVYGYVDFEGFKPNAYGEAY